MSAPIKREDIRKGDRVKQSWVFTAKHDFGKSDMDAAAAFELIERPVTLPTAPGFYLDKDGDVWAIKDERGLLYNRGPMSAGVVASFAPFTLLRPVAEVAAEVLAALDVDNIIPHGVYTRIYTGAQLHAIAAKFGVRS